MDYRETTPPDSGSSPSWEEELRQAAEEAAARYESEGQGEGGYGAPPPPRSGRVDLSVLFVMLDSIRRAMPRDLSRQFTALVRETLLTLRSLIDWYLQRLDRAQKEPQVEEIKID